MELIVVIITLTCVFQVMGRQLCSNRLESALESMRRRNQHMKSRSLLDLTPYSLYHSLYGRGVNQLGESDLHGDRYQVNDEPDKRQRSEIPSKFDYPYSTEFNLRRPPHHTLPVTRVEVDDLKVRLPPNPSARWVEVDKCQFSLANATLDTRLIFPDLTISGKVIFHPRGGKCNMILRLRHAGIEFRTIPMGIDVAGSDLNEEARRTASASVRTDSHFAEPGFISVFAHGCQGPSGYTFRHNSKRRFGQATPTATLSQIPPTMPDLQLSEPQVFIQKHENSKNHRWGKVFNPFDYKNILRNHLERESERGRYGYDNRGEPFHTPRSRSKRYARIGREYNEDIVNFSDDILNVGDDLQELVQSDARAFAEVFGADEEFGARTSSVEISEAFTQELEKLFSSGVRGLLTTYMQRALQPAIKETLMENMGYTISYG